MKNPLFLALDVEDWAKAHDLAQELGPHVGGFKVGPRLSLKASPLDWQSLADQAPVFFDPKFYDIPNTMAESIKACADKGMSYVTVHATSGIKALEQVAKMEAKINESQFFKVLCVTVLTSFDSDKNPIPGFNKDVQTTVTGLAQMSHKAGLRGVVCSGEEVKSLKKDFPDMFSVVPGIRLQEDSKDDQARVLSPEKALSLGADALVVGRSIINDVHPMLKLQKYLELI